MLEAASVYKENIFALFVYNWMQPVELFDVGRLCKFPLTVAVFSKETDF